MNVIRGAIILAGAESFNWLGHTFDVSRAKEIIEQAETGTIDIANLNVEKWAEFLQTQTPSTDPRSYILKPGVLVNEKHAATTNLDLPGIVVHSRKLGPFLIDGWHRLWKHKQEGKEVMKVYYIKDPEEVKQIELR